MNWRRPLNVALFFGAFSAGCVALAPAALLGRVLEAASSGNLTLSMANGTLWNGSGVVVFQSNGRFISIGEYAWRFQPATVISHGLSFVVRQADDVRPMTVSLSPFRSQVMLQEWRAVLPAQMLEILSPQLRPYRFGGEIEVESGSLVLSTRGVEGRVFVNWNRAGSALSEVYPLGNYRIAMQGTGRVVDVDLSTQSGKLLLSGQGRLEQGKGLTFNGTARASPGDQEALSELLHHLGPETTPGVFSLMLIPQAGG